MRSTTLLGIRIRTDTYQQCYTLLGTIHRLWPPIEGRFKDYIARPKANQYRSLHTTVMCMGGRRMEIQIRTHEMDSTAEFGVAAHWAYKNASRGQVRSREHVFINQLKEWNALSISNAELLGNIKQELLKDSIYVFTPQGHIVELPKQSTRRGLRLQNSHRCGPSLRWSQGGRHDHHPEYPPEELPNHRDNDQLSRQTQSKLAEVRLHRQGPEPHSAVAEQTR